MNKLSTLSRVGCILLAMNGFLSVNAQLSEPTNFDWKESFDMTTKHEVFYDQDLIPSIPKDAMFWVDIQPKVKKQRKSNFSKDGNMIYEHTEVLEHKLNGEDFNYGFVEMIHANGRSFYTLSSDPQNFIENPNVSSSGDNLSGPLFSPGLSFANFEQSMQQNAQGNFWIPIYDQGEIWYRLTAADLEINVDVPNGIMRTRNLETGALSYDKYEEVEPNIWRNTMNVEIVPEQTIEGYCIERRTTTTRNNFSFDINNAGQEARTSEEVLSQLDLVEVKQEEGELSLKRIESQSNFDLIIYDVMGRVVYSKQQISDDRINFQAPHSGIYFVTFIQEGKSEVTKLYLH